ncbi:MAG: hypothetical protein ACREQY_23945, partial [Candidatus Binatia bacterium]
MKRTSRRKNTGSETPAASVAPDVPSAQVIDVPPPPEFEGLLDDVKATTLALLASLQDKERTLR